MAATKTVGKLSLSAVGNRFSQKPHRSRILKSYSSSGTGLTQDLRRSPSAYHYRFIPKPNNDTEENAMQEFIAKHQDKIAGTLSGFDRLVFRGHLRSIGHPQGMMTYLWFNQVLLKNFGDHVAEVTERLKEASVAEAKAYGRPVKYLNSSQTDKETIARNILAQDGVRGGLVCVLSCLEPCWKFEIHRNRMTKKLELKLRPGKCLFLYIHAQIFRQHPLSYYWSI
jgi:hypothetical protein